jgi:Tol biopolymer transport system component
MNLPILNSPRRGISRRDFVSVLGAAAAAASAGCAAGRGGSGAGVGRLFFTSDGKTCLIHADGTGLRPLEVSSPGQVTWQPCGFLEDGRVLLLSMEARRDGPGRPFDEYYHQTPTHVWAHDLDQGTLEELATRERVAPFQTPQLVLSEGRILMQVIPKRPGHIVNMRLDGTDAQEFTGNDEGLPYGLSLSPDGSRVAFHLAGPKGYQIWTSDTRGRNRALVAAHPDYLFFGPTWSPDGRWLTYQACRFREDPGHDWADLCIGRPEGGEHRLLTMEGAMWFGATYGSARRRGGGSNVPVWTRDGRILFPRRIPGSRVPWEYQAQRPDTDHFNREFRPEQARGGVSICRFDPATGRSEDLTRPTEGVWDFRSVESPDGRWIAFCRAETGGSPGLWVQSVKGGEARLLTRGLGETGADHPRWLPGMARQF